MSNNIELKSILLLTANPKRTAHLRLQEEERDIRERLRLAGYGKVSINSTGATRPRDIQQAMLDFRPQIVHFRGHGAGQDGLVFEDNTGNTKLIGTEALANLFKLFSNDVKCVLLNACYSRLQAELIAQYIDFVIGMSQDIGDHAAIEFSVGFYSALGAGESVEFAYKLGCNAIQLQGIAEYLTPKLIQRSELYSSKSIDEIQYSHISTRQKSSDEMHVKLNSCQVENISFDKQKTKFKIIIDQEVDEAQLGKIAGPLTELLQRITGDSTLQIKRVDSGSIQLFIEGSSQAFKRLQELQESGELSRLLNMPVIRVELELDSQEGKTIQDSTLKEQQSSSSETIAEMQIGAAEDINSLTVSSNSRLTITGQENYLHIGDPSRARQEAAKVLANNHQALIREAINSVSRQYPDFNDPRGFQNELNRYLRAIQYSIVAGGTGPLNELVIVGQREVFNVLGIPVSPYIEAMTHIKNSSLLVQLMSPQARAEITTYIDYLITSLI